MHVRHQTINGLRRGYGHTRLGRPDAGSVNRRTGRPASLGGLRAPDASPWLARHGVNPTGY
ncbi:hypothetical protein JVX90_14120 [Gordonia sp. PDNC005]|uniref:hypothetical protein n=1 Tax=unclassified Gordonia (in: high G+C Gram-positive bacteria) TaxID=2657482 RepID=UPI001963AF8C|nr:hypothetical protein [Gordonia sp. PDNC005]QRY61546.1 hypothetical protein JVX90_14120 [Gordonia sp. PDNC005]